MCEFNSDLLFKLDSTLTVAIIIQQHNNILNGWKWVNHDFDEAVVWNYTVRHKGESEMQNTSLKKMERNPNQTAET